VATRTQVIKIDDIDGRELDGDGNTIAFAVRGVEYKIDLSDKNMERFDKALEPYVSAAQKLGGRRSGRSAASGVDSRAVRKWAESRGIALSRRGRIPASVVEEYRAAGN
jgi:hypothetical protein